MNKELVIGEIYHIYTKSIAGFRIFNNDSEFLRMLEVVKYYQCEDRPISFFRFNQFQQKATQYSKGKMHMNDKEKLVEIIAYCIMPTHLHLVLKQLKENGISIFLKNILNSYSRYFNIKHNRKGPLWEGRFKRVLVKKDEYLLHLTRYVHLNPATAKLIDDPAEWGASSYKEYIHNVGNNAICKYDDILEIIPNSYKKFVKDRISYQRELARIKHLLFD